MYKFNIYTSLFLLWKFKLRISWAEIVWNANIGIIPYQSILVTHHTNAANAEW